MRFCTAWWGGGMAAFEFWYLCSDGMVLLAFLILPVCIGLGWLFAYFMWEASKDYIARVSLQANEPHATDTNNPGEGGRGT